MKPPFKDLYLLLFHFRLYRKLWFSFYWLWLWFWCLRPRFRLPFASLRLGFGSFYLWTNLHITLPWESPPRPKFPSSSLRPRFSSLRPFSSPKLFFWSLCTTMRFPCPSWSQHFRNHLRTCALRSFHRHSASGNFVSLCAFCSHQGICVTEVSITLCSFHTFHCHYASRVSVSLCAFRSVSSV